MITSEEIKEQVGNLISQRNNLTVKFAIEIKKIDQAIAALQEQCKHENKESFRQEYIGSWEDCSDCGKEDV
jgi:hypothetical protein